ncbi:FHA domain-containing protein [Cohnella cellulosilytica]|uniref:FHA domain-containing protein n=1 Tax=Cohnella cellulosilytica TaxID=986710 RepID=A0ABW2FEU8_9BACL
MKKLNSCLVVIRGFPYDEGTTLRIARPNVILGRKDIEWEPDIGFENAYVSRKQAAIRYDQGGYTVTDFESKHGTEVNGVKLVPFAPHPLHSSDTISFARGMVCLTFSTSLWEETMDFSPTSPLAPSSAGYELDPVRRLLHLRDLSYSFSDKEYRCLELLLGRERQFVPKEEILRYVWPERSEGEPLPAAGPEELNSLLYRIRKKTNAALSIENIRGKGYILTLSDVAAKYV